MTQNIGKTTLLSGDAPISIPVFALLRLNQDFQLLSLVGGGGMAKLYTIKPTSQELIISSFGQTMVAKMLTNGFTDMSEKMQQSFLQEVSLM